MSTNKRHRSPNGSARAYRDGDRWKQKLSATLPTGSTVTAIGSGPTQQKAMQRAKQNLATKVAEAAAPADHDLRTTGGWCQHWLTAIKASSLRYKTIVSYQHAIDASIVPAIGEVALADVTIEHIDSLYRAWAESGRAASSWATTRTVLKQAFDVAVRRGHIAANPVLHAPNAPRKHRSTQVLTVDETRRLFRACSSASQRSRWMCSLVLGLRQGEALGLQWRDIDLDGPNPTLRVQRTLQRQTGKGLVTGDPKTAKSRRTLELPPELVSELRDHRKQQVEALFAIGMRVTQETHVYTSGWGTPKDPANDRKAWLAILVAAHLPAVRLHAARHTSATLMINSGIDISVVGSVLGHSTIATTADIYGHVSGAVAGDALRKISAQVTA